LTGPLFAQVGGLFLQPALAAAGVAAVSIPVAIHLLSRRRRQPVEWAAMRFLQEAWRRHRRRMRIEEWLLLAIRCLIVLLAGLALAGPVAGALGGGAGARDWWIVLDNGFDTRARAPSREPVIERLREEARTFLAELPPGSRAAVLPAHAMGEAPAPTADRDALRAQIGRIEPRWDRPALDAALPALAERAGQQVPAGALGIAIVSPWRPGTLERPGAGALKDSDLARRIHLRAWPPAPTRRNHWIEGVAPARSLLVVEPGSGATLPVEVVLGRSGERPAGRTRVRVALLDPGRGARFASGDGEARWREGERTTRLRVDLALAARQADRLFAGRSSIEAAVRATMDADALPEDDRRVAMVALKRRRVVALRGRADRPGMGPDDWLELALAPGRGAGVELEQGAGEAGGPDARFIAEAAQVGGERFERWLEALEASGGLLWLAPDRERGWGGAKAALTALGFRSRGAKLEAPEEAGWRLATGDPPPLFSGLASDYEALIRPVRVHRIWPIEVDEAATVLLRTEAGDPLLVHRALGAGDLLLWTTAIDPAWTNLPVKPLFVPLIHEVLRTLDARRSLPAAPVGRRLRLGAGFEGIERLVDPAGGEVALERGEAGPVTAAPLARPGLYRAELDGGERWIAAVLEGAPGELAGMPRSALTRWLQRQPASASIHRPGQPPAETGGPARAALAGPLLVALLGLVLLETLLARRFSHAERGEGPGWLTRLRRRLAGGGA